LTRSISIIIPAYNEEKRLPSTLAQVLDYLRQREWSFAEVIVVDDGSTDGTAAAAEEVARNTSIVRLLRNPGNRGKGYSVRHGMLEAKGEWSLFSDADLSAPIEELGKLWDAVEKSGANVAIGSRALNRSLIGVHQSVFREYGGRVFNLILRLITGLPFWDTQCGFKLFETCAAREIFRRQQLEGFGFDAEVLFLARLLGNRIVEIPVRWNHVEGTKMRLMQDSVGMIIDLLRIRRNQVSGKYQ
jgi:glycosyltransferase involved in cell wall biosynthesis